MSTHLKNNAFFFILLTLDFFAIYVSLEYDIETFTFLMVSRHVADGEMHQNESQKRLNHLLGTL